MIEWLRCWILGIVQGLTEFLPISSDGHLSLLQILTSGTTNETGSDFVFFDVMLHVGTTAAIIICFRKQVFAGLKGLLGQSDVPDLYQRPALLRLAVLAFVATLPLVPLALFLKKAIDQTYQSLLAVGVG